MYVSGAAMRGGASVPKALRALCLSWTGNLAGALLLAYMIHWSAVYLDGSGSGSVAAYVVKLAAGKCSQGFWPLFVKGVLCNQLVCLAVFMSLSASSPAAKALLIWPPVFGFVALGMEHSVANMFFIPAGILTASWPGMASAPASGFVFGWGDFLVRNLVPVTLGNVVGGALFVAAPYCLGFRDHGSEGSGRGTDRAPAAGDGDSGGAAAGGGEKDGAEAPDGKRRG
jgi:formate/nitrite transporter